MNKKNLNVIILIIHCLSFNNILPNNGGAVAAGVLGGLGAGILFTAAASNRPRSREVVYIDRDYRSQSNYNNSRFNRRDLSQREQDLDDREERLNRLEKRLSRKEKELNLRQITDL